MKPSNLIENSWGNMGFSRYSFLENQVLSAVYGPYESRNSQKSSYKKCVLEVVVSDVTTQTDHSNTEKILADLFSSVISTEKYPYLTIMICIQIFSKDENILSTIITSVYSALLETQLFIRYELIAKDFFSVDTKLTLVIVPNTDLVLLSLCNASIELDYYKSCVKALSAESF